MLNCMREFIVQGDEKRFLGGKQLAENTSQGAE